MTKIAAPRRRPSADAPAPPPPPAGERPAAPDPNATLFNRGTRVEVGGTGEGPTRVYVVRRWSIGLLDEVSSRLPELLQDLLEGQSPDAAAASLLPGVLAELRWIVGRTLAIEEAEILEHWAAEDLLDVATVVCDVCLVPIAGKLGGLGTRLLGLLPRAPTTTTPTPPSPSPARSSG